MNIEEFVQQLEAKLGIGPLKFSDEGVLSFTFNEEYIANIEKSGDDRLVMVYAHIGDLPLEQQEACLRALLEANLFGQKTQGASFGIDPDTNEIYLFRSFEVARASFEQFYDDLSRFLQTQVEWTQIVKTQGFAPPPKKSKEPSIYL